MRRLIASAMKTRFMRFLCSGGVNTAITYIIYLLLLQILTYQASYTIAYVSGVAISFALNKLFVFEAHQGWKSIIFFPFVYFAQYLFGIVVLWLFVSQLGVAVELGPLAVVVLTIPLTYWLSKLTFVGLKNKANSDIGAK